MNTVATPSPIHVFIHYGQKQGDALLFMMLNFDLDSVIRKEQEGLKLGTHHLLVYAEDVNFLRENINVIKKRTEILIEVRRIVYVHISSAD